MKYLFVLVLALCAYKYFEATKIEQAQQSMPIKTYKDVFDKLQVADVSNHELLTAASHFALNLCDDDSYQSAGGETKASCIAKFEAFREMCAERIFTQPIFTQQDEPQIKQLTKRFVNCVGT
ncbi:hypothetical protein ACFSJY_18560 [Thalassotalea euphylliae]|uniref:hypothetical protein n=1 Tax=Thalassotalea euphylliae TaxID=1655234 RepID=UPI00362802C3